mmetsp:Transcript_29804/g.72219  ORF Transcript_29804/g.72219 Transcript_29804/m.72219 type:complete len:868 (-) Transcript_29804:92-2695(-)
MVDNRDQQHVAITPIIAGDFNCEDDELLDGLFADSTGDPSTRLFTDVWVDAGSPSHGFTFDTVTNPRAARSSRLVDGKIKQRRIDRIFVGPTFKKGRVIQGKNLKPTDVGILGSLATPELPPSDHFGVKATLRRTKVEDVEPLYPMSIPKTLWSANSPPSRQSLLALILDNPDVESLKKTHNETSTLSRLHITLLHGFVEATFGCLDLATKVVQQALYATNEHIAPPKEITFHDNQALELFQHPNSCSLVAVPDQTSPAYHWLCLFYTELRQRFVSCDDQERHSKSGWNPHVTLAAVGSSVRATEMQALWNESGSWQAGNKQMTMVSIDILTRSDDGTFHSVSSIPCQSKPKIVDTVNSLLRDGGTSIAQSIETESSFVILFLRRICRKVGEKMHVNTSLHLSGSARLGAAIPGMSDIDMVLKVEPHAGSRISATKESSLMETFFQQMIQELTNEYDDLRIRLRQASGNTILTLRLPSHPSVDIALCICDVDGRPVNSSSQVTLDSLMTVQKILRSLHNAGGLVLVEAYKQALRTIKVWAIHKDVYGSSTGFLGGGGYAVWMAKACLLFWTQQGHYLAVNMTSSTDDLVEQLVRYFFNSVTTVPAESICLGVVEPRSESEPDDESSPYHHRHRPGTLSIRPPCDSTSGSDFGRSTTRSTAQRIVTEMKNASCFLGSRKNDGGHRRSLLELLLKQPCSLEDFLSQFPSVILMKVSCNSDGTRSSTFTNPQCKNKKVMRPAEWKAWGDTQFLNMVVSLETDACASTVHFGIDPTQMIHPKSRPVIRQTATTLNDGGSTRTFTWIVGITGTFSDRHDKDEQLFLRRLRLWMEEYKQLQLQLFRLESANGTSDVVQLGLYSSEDAKLEFLK